MHVVKINNDVVLRNSNKKKVKCGLLGKQPRSKLFFKALMGTLIESSQSVQVAMIKTCINTIAEKNTTLALLNKENFRSLRNLYFTNYENVLKTLNI